MSGFSGSIAPETWGEFGVEKKGGRPASHIQRPSALHEVDACTQHAACWEEKASGLFTNVIRPHVSRLLQGFHDPRKDPHPPVPA